MMTRLISSSFPSVKLRDHNTNHKSPVLKGLTNLRTQFPISSSSSQEKSNIPTPKSWSVYLILSTTKPIKTYVGITTDFARRFRSMFSLLKAVSFQFIDFKESKKKEQSACCCRLRQHNGEIRGGAKASSAGRPWLCACIITGFTCLSQASSFESKWKIYSRKLPRRKTDEEMNQSDALLQHRKRALDKVEDSLNCSHLEVDWKIL